MTLPPLDENAALFLDFDGTLVDIAARPDAIRIDPALPPLLHALEARLRGAVAVVTGRPVAEIDRYLANGRLTVAGLHGLERRVAGGAVEREPVPVEALHGARRRLRSLADRWPGILIEDKGSSIALHFREAPAAEQACLDAALAAVDASGGTLELLNGKMLFEVKPAGMDKGMAVDALMTAAPFAGRRPVFIGDDVTDEHGFDVVNRRGGLSIRVGNGGYSKARFRAESVEELLAWLSDFAASGQGQPRTMGGR